MQPCALGILITTDLYKNNEAPEVRGCVFSARLRAFQAVCASH